MDHAADQLDDSEEFTCMHCLANYDDPVLFFDHLHQRHFVHGGDDHKPDSPSVVKKQDCDGDSGLFLDFCFVIRTYMCMFTLVLYNFLLHV